MDTIKRTVNSNPAAVAAQQQGRPLGVDIAVELRNGNTGVSARSARSMGGEDDWTRVLSDSLEQQGIDAVLPSGAQPVGLVRAQRVQEAVQALQRMTTDHVVGKVGVTPGCLRNIGM